MLKLITTKSIFYYLPLSQENKKFHTVTKNILNYNKIKNYLS